MTSDLSCCAEHSSRKRRVWSRNIPEEVSLTSDSLRLVRFSLPKCQRKARHLVRQSAPAPSAGPPRCASFASWGRGAAQCSPGRHGVPKEARVWLPWGSSALGTGNKRDSSPLCRRPGAQPRGPATPDFGVVGWSAGERKRNQRPPARASRDGVEACSRPAERKSNLRVVERSGAQA